MHKRLYCDIETSGLNPQIHGITQIAAIVELDGKVVDSLNLPCLIRPEEKIEAKALEIQGLFEHEIREGEGRHTARNAHIIFTEFMRKYVNPYNKKDKFHFVGFNSQAFDAVFLNQWFRKNQDNYFYAWFFNPTIDVYVLAGYFMEQVRVDFPNFQLATVCRRVNLPWEEEEAHDAMYDITMTRKLFLECERLLKKKFGNSQDKV